MNRITAPRLDIAAALGAFLGTSVPAIAQLEEVIVTAIPLYHIFALMVNFITYFTEGADNWLVANPRDMDGFVAVMKAARPTPLWVWVGVPLCL